MFGFHHLTYFMKRERSIYEENSKVRKQKNEKLFKTYQVSI
jgi:hypothetical protein